MESQTFEISQFSNNVLHHLSTILTYEIYTAEKLRASSVSLCSLFLAVYHLQAPREGERRLVLQWVKSRAALRR